MKLSISSSFVDWDAYNLTKAVVEAVKKHTIPTSQITCIISTRDIGDNALTDQILAKLHKEINIPVICFSAQKFGRLKRKNEATKQAYDQVLLDAVKIKVGSLPDVNMMLGDMVIKSSVWCNKIPSLNLHPDLPLSMGGTEGIYWDVIGRWVSLQRNEIGGMVHLAIPTLDAGTAVAYFKLSSRRPIAGIDLASLWDSLPKDQSVLDQLISDQTGLKDAPTHQLFIALRKAEAQFEFKLVESTLRMIAIGKIKIEKNEVYDEEGNKLISGLDLTEEVIKKNCSDKSSNEFY